MVTPLFFVQAVQLLSYHINKLLIKRYGEPTYLPIDENHPTGGCTNPYGKTKFFMEEIMKVSMMMVVVRIKNFV